MPNPANIPADIAKIQVDEATLAADTATLAADAAASVGPVTPPPVVTPLAVATLFPQTVTVGTACSFPVAVTGGTTPYAATAEGLTPGLTISGTTIKGTPTTAGKNTFTVTVTDKSNPVQKITTPSVTWTTVTASVGPVTPPPTGSIVPVVPSSLAVPTIVVLDDEFNAGALNTKLWAPVWFTNGSSGSNGTTMESSNVSVGANGLALTLTSAKTGGLVSSNPSDGVSGHTGFQIAPTSGNPVYVEFKVTTYARSNGQIANWPAFWLDGQSWPKDGEIDVMEGLGGTAAYHIHYGSGSGSSQGGNVNTSPGTHTYGVLWTTTNQTFVYDGKVAGTTTESLTQPQYLIMENSIDASSSVVAGTVNVHYVRVWHGPVD